MSRTPREAAHMEKRIGGPDLKGRRIEAFGHDDREEFAALVGVSPRTVANWESAKGHVPVDRARLVLKVLERAAQPSERNNISSYELIAILSDRLREYEELKGRLASLETPPS